MYLGPKGWWYQCGSRFTPLVILRAKSISYFISCQFIFDKNWIINQNLIGLITNLLQYIIFGFDFVKVSLGIPITRVLLHQLVLIKSISRLIVIAHCRICLLYLEALVRHGLLLFDAPAAYFESCRIRALLQLMILDIIWVFR